MAAGAMLEAALVVASSATAAVTESRGFRDAFGGASPGWLSALFDGVRRALSTIVVGLGGPRDATQAAAVVLVGGFVLAGAAYLFGLATRPASKRTILAFALLFDLTLLVMPGLLSTDLLTYATYGRLAAVYGQNPYLSAPSVVLSDPLVQWLDTRPEHATPYGPVWTLLSMGIAWLTSGLPPLLQAASYRLVGACSMLAGSAIVWRLRRDPSSVLLFAWNPLLLVEVVGNGHNDGPMMVVALGGLLLLQHDRARVGLLVLGLAALVKYVPGLLLVYAGAALARSRPRVVVATAAAMLALGIALWLPWLGQRGPGVVLASVSAGGERYVNALLDLPTGWVATHLLDRSGQDVAAAEAAVRAGPRAIVRVLFLVYVAWAARRIWRSPGLLAVVEAGVRGYLVALLLVVTQVLSWYFAWPLALAAVLGWRSTLARVAVAYGVVYLPVFYAIHADLVPGGNPAPLLLAWAIVPLLIVSRSRSGLASLASRVEGRYGPSTPRDPQAATRASRPLDRSTARRLDDPPDAMSRPTP